MCSAADAALMHGGQHLSFLLAFDEEWQDAA